MLFRIPYGPKSFCTPTFPSLFSIWHLFSGIRKYSPNWKAFFCLWDLKLEIFPLFLTILADSPEWYRSLKFASFSKWSYTSHRWKQFLLLLPVFFRHLASRTFWAKISGVYTNKECFILLWLFGKEVENFVGLACRNSLLLVSYLQFMFSYFPVHLPISTQTSSKRSISGVFVNFNYSVKNCFFSLFNLAQFWLVSRFLQIYELYQFLATWPN